MFKHVLIPTDGSPLAKRASVAGIKFANTLGARVTGYCAVSPLRQEFYGESIARDPALLRVKRRAMEAGKRHVAVIERAARAAEVRFRPLVDSAEPTYQGIIDAARKCGCDVIFMPSHGRRGLKRLLLGSVTSQVLAHSKRPVVVYR